MGWADRQLLQLGVTAPPLVLWSLSLKARSLPAPSQGSHYAINILAAEQRHLAERFASQVADRFEGINFHLGAAGAPVLEGVAAVFECFNRSQYERGSSEVTSLLIRPVDV